MHPTLAAPARADQAAPELLARLAAALRKMRTLPEILDDIGDALDPQPPAATEVEDIHERLREDLERLGAIAEAAGIGDPEVWRLIARAAELEAVELPQDHHGRIVHLRKQGAVANDLLERLTATRTIKQVA
ncbi:hypothetical protein E5083_30525 [Streptomyces bauhiniae]|uniref:Uncharacterized protein n=1 Tax=Streptomyces bauhiniae TaxID=2340725 RepID=A0A4Z1CU12_9ACTN|nr:DUF6415 family natural product biosynthesis protein [Streptomyces bauhiniae]TGN72269.1 hypothetical protein E5083_30525 [Streptomyces bauhiniae]